jgi:hypothetical protein
VRSSRAIATALLAAWLGGCTTTVVDFAPRDVVSPADGGSKADTTETDPKLDAAASDASGDGALPSFPDGGGLGISATPLWMDAGPAYFVEYKCCVNDANCVVRVQGDGVTCIDDATANAAATRDCDGMGAYLYGLGFANPC